MKIPRFVAFAFVVIVSLFSARFAQAHHGFESVIDVRLLENQTFVVVRTTPSVLARLLGSESPGVWSEQSVANLAPRLQELARGFLLVHAGEQKLVPADPRVSLEVNGQLAFVFKYPAAPSGPFSVEAAYFKNAGDEFTGTLTIFGPPENPAERHGPRLGLLELTPRSRLLQIPNAPAAPGP